MGNRTYSFRVVWSDEDEAYVATCPEFDGVSGFGASADEAMREAQASLELAIEAYEDEGWQLPEPVSLIEHSGQFRLRLPKSLHARLVQRAADDGISLNACVATLVAIGLGEADAYSHTRRAIESLLSDIRAEVAQGFVPAGALAATSTTSLPAFVPSFRAADGQSKEAQWHH